jgi:hypothetical protein
VSSTLVAAEVVEVTPNTKDAAARFVRAPD